MRTSSFGKPLVSEADPYKGDANFFMSSDSALFVFK